jgi:hypothetical protein
MFWLFYPPTATLRSSKRNALQARQLHPQQGATVMPSPEEKEQRIRERAYQIWLDEGQPDGREREHWRQAEEQINAEEGEQSEPDEQSPPLAGPYENVS